MDMRITIHTDGSCLSNPGPAGIGVCIETPDDRTEVSEPIGIATNNIAELMAIERGLRLVLNGAMILPTPVVLRTDSKYAIGVCFKGWRARANAGIVRRIRLLSERFIDLRVEWVRGHDGDPGNERADRLARRAAERNEI